MLSIINILLVFSLNIFSHNSAHEFHFSKCIIEHKASTNTLQISWHVFLDDLELALESQGVTNLFLCTDKEATKGELYLKKYLMQNLHLEIDEENLELEWIGKELSDDLTAVWCYFEVREITQIEEIKITNTLLTELFDDQKNLIHFLVQEKPAFYFLFNKSHKVEIAKF